MKGYQIIYGQSINQSTNKDKLVIKCYGVELI